MAIDTTGPAWQPALRVAANSRANLKSLWFFTVLWNVVSAPVLIYIPSELARNPLAGLGLVFPMVGVGLLGWTLLATRRWRRFGETTLEQHATAHPGATWIAAMHARLPQPEAGESYTVALRLSCLQRTISGSDGDREERERILWREEAEVPSTRLAFAAEHATIPVRFDIPADALPTTVVGKGEGVLWVLTAEAALPDVDLREDFDVPVRRTGVPGAEDPGPPPGDAPASTARLDPGTASITVDDLARTGIAVAPSPDGTTFTFAARRNLSFAFGVTVFTAIWTGALWLQWFLGFPWIFPILTGLVELLLLYVVIDLWLGTTVVTVSPGTLRVRRRVFGAGGSRTVDAADVAWIELHIGMQTQGRYGTPYYDVRARLKNGRKVTLGGGVRNKRHAEWLADRMASAAGTKRAV